MKAKGDAVALVCLIANSGVGRYEGGDCSTAVVVVVDVVLLALEVVAPADDSAEVVSVFWRLDALCGRTGLWASPCARFCEPDAGKTVSTWLAPGVFTGDDGGLMVWPLSLVRRLASFCFFASSASLLALISISLSVLPSVQQLSRNAVLMAAGIFSSGVLSMIESMNTWFDLAPIKCR